jgi:hypothetical protein
VCLIFIEENKQTLVDLEVIALLLNALKNPVSTLMLERGVWSVANFAANPQYQADLMQVSICIFSF